MKKTLTIVLFILIIPVFLSAQEVTSIFERSIDKSKVDVQRIAVIPNRLPLVLQESEYWIENNWNIIRDILIGSGFEVVPYGTTITVAADVGLPLEDTFSSADKFYDFCNETGADLVIMPYYGTSFRARSPFIGVNTYEYIATVSFQFYSPDANQFMHRADASAKKSFTNGYLALGGTASTISASFLLGKSPEAYITLYSVGGALLLVDNIWTIVRMATPETKWYGQAFEQAIYEALQPFLAFTGRGTAGSFQFTGSAGTASDNMPITYNSSTPSTAAEYLIAEKEAEERQTELEAGKKSRYEELLSKIDEEDFTAWLEEKDFNDLYESGTLDDRLAFTEKFYDMNRALWTLDLGLQTKILDSYDGFYASFKSIQLSAEACYQIKPDLGFGFGIASGVFFHNCLMHSYNPDDYYRYYGDNLGYYDTWEDYDEGWEKFLNDYPYDSFDINHAGVVFIPLDLQLYLLWGDKSDFAFSFGACGNPAISFYKDSIVCEQTDYIESTYSGFDGYNWYVGPAFGFYFNNYFIKVKLLFNDGNDIGGEFCFFLNAGYSLKLK